MAILLHGPHFASPPREPRATSTRPLRRDLRCVISDGASFSVMVGLGETYLPAFALAAGLSGVATGLIAVLPMLAGALLQLGSPAAVRWLGSHRRWVVWCAAVQAASFLPLFLMAASGWIPAAAVFLAATIYWGAGLATGPAWNTWIGRIVPSRIRANFFARRTRVSQAGVLVGFLLGGLALQWGSNYDRELLTFAGLFAVAGLCRTISAVFLYRQSEPAQRLHGHRSVGPLELLRRTWRGGDSCLLLYLLCVQVAVQISGPFFTPFMLGHLQMSYTEYVLLLGAAFGAKIIALPALGRIAKRAGARRLLWLGGCGIVPVAACWLVADSFYYLFAVQLLSGFAWAAYELAMFLLFFETIHEEERTSVLTTFNVGNALAMVFGSLLGGALLAWLGEETTSYYVVFAASSATRLAALIVLVWVTDVQVEVVPIATRTISVSPTGGSVDRPILPGLPDGPTSDSATTPLPAWNSDLVASENAA